MTAFVPVLVFTSVADVTFDFNAGDNDVQVFQPTRETRGTPRARMQMHGTNPRNLFFSGVEVDHEGVFGGDTQSDVSAQRTACLAAILGDLTQAPPSTQLGTLTVQMIDWDETATGPVQLDSYTAAIGAGDILTLAYQFQWRFDLPYLIGDESEDVYYL